MPETVTSTISNTVSADYSTLQAWEDAAPADLVAADQIWRGEIIAADTFSAGTGFAITFFGSTADSTRYKELTVADGFSFADDPDNPLRYDSTKGASIEVTSGQCIRIDEAYARVSRVQCYSTTAATPILVLANARGAQIDKIIMEAENFNGQFRSQTVSCKVSNSLFINRTGGKSSVVSTSVSGALVDFYNCTFVVPSDLTANTHSVFLDTGTTGTFTNCAFFNCSSTDTISGSGSATFTACAGEDATPPTGYTTVTFSNANFRVGVNTNSDFRTYENSLLKNAGTTSATYASTDIFGNARPVGVAYDIGAYEKPLPATITSTISNSVTADYSTPQAWEDASPANLITADQVWKGVIVAPDHFSTGASNAITIGGSTTSATTYKELTVAPGVSFSDKTNNALRFDASKGAAISTTTGLALFIQESYVKVSRVQFFSTTATNQSSIASGVSNVHIDRVIFETSGNNGAYEGTSNVISNSLFINRKSAASLLIGTNVSGATTDFYNCTFVVPSDITAATSTAWTATGTTFNFTNCAFMNTCSSSIGTGPGSRVFTTCAANLASPPAGVTNISFANAGFIVGVDTNRDFRIGSSSSLKDIGTESPTYASTDIFGKERPYNNNYDIGCHEYAVYAADGLAYNHSFNKRRRRHL